MNHHECLMNAYMSSLAPRTWRNKMNHIKLYLNFCLEHDDTVHAPSVYDLLSYLLYLSDRLKSPGVVVNYFSSVKTWIKSGPGSTVAFDSYEVKIMKRGIFKNTKHVVAHAPPLVPLDFKRIITFLYSLIPIPAPLTQKL